MTQAKSTENVVQEIRRKTRRARCGARPSGRGRPRPSRPPNRPTRAASPPGRRPAPTPNRPPGRRGPGVSPAGPVLEWRGASWTKKAPKNTETGLAAGFAPSSRRNRGDEEI